MTKQLIFKHSGRLGDIVYSLPLVRHMAETAGEAAELYIPSDIPSRLGGDVYHPGGDLMVGPALFRFIEPLLAVQTYLKKVHFVKSSELPAEFIDLDAFKTSGLNLKAGLIQGWYRKAFGVAFPLEAPWLFLPDARAQTEARQPSFDVLIGRTTRFCNTSINYGFLDSIEKVGFIGLKYEYDDFVERYGLKSIRHVPVSDALELATRMQDCRVYVGNQSVNFAIADGMKICRALEAFEPVPVASPVGGVCFEYTQTRALGAFLSNILGKNIVTGEDFEGEYCDSIKPQEGYKPPLKDRIKKFLRQRRSR